MEHKEYNETDNSLTGNSEYELGDIPNVQTVMKITL